jgi:tRNA nucleotidyltransferase (CCA-adding enzyme)
MRGIRFSSQLSFTIESKTKEAIFSLKDGLKEISAERISVELDKLLMGDNVYSVLTEYTEVLSVVIPEIKPCIDFEQKNPYHIYTVWEHIAKAVEKSSKKIDVRLSMLFHDIGKPRCFSVDEKGVGHFKGHEEISAEMAKEIMQRLKKSNDTIKTVSTLVAMHYIKPSKENNDEFSDKQIRKILSKISREEFFLLTDVLRADSMSKAEFAHERLPAIDRMEKKAEEMYEREECLSLKDLALNGNDISDLGYKGKEIGEALSFLLDAVISEKVANKREKLIEYLTKRGL